MFRKILFGLLVCLFILGVSKASFAMMPCGSKQSEHKDKMQLAQADMGNMQMDSMQMNQETAVSAPAATESTEQAEDVGNKICPVSGEKIDEETKATYEYQGKIYNFCCPMCIDEFKKDPEKYIEKIDEEKQKEATETKTTEKNETEEVEPLHSHGM